MVAAGFAATNKTRALTVVPPMFCEARELSLHAWRQSKKLFGVQLAPTQGAPARGVDGIKRGGDLRGLHRVETQEGEDHRQPGHD